jgi:hypothetical protein
MRFYWKEDEAHPFFCRENIVRAIVPCASLQQHAEWCCPSSARLQSLLQ